MNAYFVFSPKESISEGRSGGRNGDIMTIDGVVQKTSFLLAVTVIAAAFTWMQVRTLQFFCLMVQSFSSS